MTQPLSSLLTGLAGFDLVGSEAVSVTGITCDSRKVVPGMVFVAVAGRREDGQLYVGEALDRGARVIVSQAGDLPVGNRTLVRVADPRLAVSRLAAAWYGYPSRSLGITGITGTNGKTSVSFLLRHIVRHQSGPCGLIGTVRYEIGDRHIPASRTTPDAVELQKLLRNMCDEGCKKVIMEVSSHALDQDRVADVSFELAAFTNLTRDHLDYHGNMEAYYLAKRRLFESLAQFEGRRAIVLNLDDGYGRRLKREMDDVRTVSFGIETNGTVDVSAEGIECLPDGTQFELVSHGTRQKVRLPLIGEYNVQNCLATVALATEMGYSLSDIAEALETVPGIPGRLEKVESGQPFSVFIDYAHTADALQRVMETLKALSPKRLLLLFGCGGGRDQGKRSEMGRVAAEWADQSWITNDNPRYEDPQQIVEQIVAGMRAAGNQTWEVELNRRRAIEEVIAAAASGDVVLIAGKGHETYQEIDGAVIPFDDRLYVEKSLENLASMQGK